MSRENTTSWAARCRRQTREQHRLACSSYLAGKNRRMSTKERALQGQEIAEDWYLQLRARSHGGDQDRETFRELEQFLREYEIITRATERGLRQKAPASRARPSGAVLWRHGPVRDHTWPGAGIPHPPPQQAVAEIRQAPRRSTIHQEIVTLRQTLKTAVRHEGSNTSGLSEPTAPPAKCPIARGFRQRNTRAL